MHRLPAGPSNISGICGREIRTLVVMATPDDGHGRQVNDDNVHDERAITQDAPRDDDPCADNCCSMPTPGQLGLQSGLPCTGEYTDSYTTWNVMLDDIMTQQNPSCVRS